MVPMEYEHRIKRFTEEVEQLRKRDLLFATYRFVAGFAGLALIVASLYLWSVWMAVLGVVTFIGFTALVLRHQAIRDERRLREIQRSINEEESVYHKGDFTQLNTGAAYRDAHHFYADDLDVFGKGSLFQRINRAHSDRGKGILADWLKQLNFDHLQERQQAIEHLKHALDWRQLFTATARKHDLQMVGQSTLASWTNRSSTSPWWTRVWVRWALSLWFPLLAFTVVLLTGSQYIDQLIYPFILNAMVFFSIFKGYRKEQEVMDDMHERFEGYAAMVAQLEAFPAGSSWLQKELAPLEVKGKKASARLAELAKILSRTDSANNLFGAVVINGLVFYHLHVFTKLLRWKEEHAAYLESWMETVHRFEAYVSLAGYAYNHPSFSFPELDEGDRKRFEAKDLGHPFLSDEKRVCNDISFDEMKLVVLTGSNMAGKSTFLRSIGLSMVMTSLGLPVCAASITMSRFELLSSMKPQDDVNENTSYFQAEVNRLRKLMDVVESGTRCFLLLDEILRGTNSEDKRNGTRGFLKRLRQYDIKGILATHDVDIAEMAKTDDAFQNYFFESGYDGKDLTFDYQLRQGVCSSPNASQLLKLKKLID